MSLILKQEPANTIPTPPAGKSTLFVDDKKVNTDAAASIGLHVWNLKVGEEDVVDLFKQKHLPL